ncbi:hypothetical protein [Granulicella arctica]|uniref:hypothetical protein n=1 Tax=Granulicella arctica TaxID=940613 RepID=UPI0021DFFEDB|nr:hypothetical protein [Granulicella arctica]
MDVHAPHEPIHSAKDFFLHLFTITVGLLIAVGIEGCVELHREHSLVKEARATLREEIEHNATALKGASSVVAEERRNIADDMDALTKIEEHPLDKTLQNASLTAKYNVQGLNEAAWKTAQMTGALAYMPYKESQRYTDIYESQHDFLADQQKILDDEAAFFGVLAKMDFGHGNVTPDKASAALERLGVWQAHLVNVSLMAKLSLMNDSAFLEGKEGPTDLHEDLNSR